MKRVAQIRKYAHECLVTGVSHPANMRAAKWHACGGTGPLTAARAEIADEIERQQAIRATRRSSHARPALDAVMRRCREALSERNDLARRLLAAHPLRYIDGTSTGKYRVGCVLVEIRRTEKCNWRRYSKRWHNTYGPARTVETAIVCSQWDSRRRHTRSREYPQTALRAIDRRAVEAVGDFLSLPAHKGHRALRIDPHVGLKEVPSPHCRCRTYARILAGEVIGYVATRRKAHYHARSAAEACDGVTRKLARSRLRRIYAITGRGTPLDIERPIGAILRSLGFCRAGTEDALDMLSLDDRQYEVSELLTAIDVRAIPAVAAKYPAEIATVAGALSGLSLPTEITAQLARYMA